MSSQSASNVLWLGGSSPGQKGGVTGWFIWRSNARKHTRHSWGTEEPRLLPALLSQEEQNFRWEEHEQSLADIPNPPSQDRRLENCSGERGHAPPPSSLQEAPGLGSFLV